MTVRIEGDGAITDGTDLAGETGGALLASRADGAGCGVDSRAPSTSRNCNRSWRFAWRALHQRLPAVWISSHRSRMILPVRSMTRNHDRSVNTVRPKRNSAMNNNMLP
ncbi:hypothetical protein D3C80_1074400 [compost metagenome]